MPVYNIPAALCSISKITGLKPNKAKSWAQASPAGPPPIIAIRLSPAAVRKPSDCALRRIATSSFDAFDDEIILTDSITAAGFFLLASAPNLSVTKRFKARMETGLSIAALRQDSSQGAWHIRPQMDANGFGPRAIR